MIKRNEVESGLQAFRTRVFLGVLLVAVVFFLWLKRYERRFDRELQNRLGIFSTLQAKCSLDGREVRSGRVIEVSYQWTSNPNFRNPGRQYAFHVGYANRDGAILWDDDHPPVRSTATWLPGETVVEKRMVFIPPVSEPTDVYIVGTLDPGREDRSERYTLSKNPQRQGGYRMGSVRLLPPENLTELGILGRVRFQEGWHQEERDAGRYRYWRWMKQRGVCFLPNLESDSRLFLRGWVPHTPFPEATKVSLYLNGLRIDRFTAPEHVFTRLFPIAGSMFGDQDCARLEIVLSQSFVPEQRLVFRDFRELGLMLHALVLERLLGSVSGP